VWEAHLPGQHYVVRLTAPDGYRAERSYSVASPPEDRGFVELTVERLADGEVSGFLHDAVRPGDELTVRGPFGGWFVWRGRTPALLVGGGSGVVPLMAMLRSRRARHLDVPLHLVVSARSREDLFYADEYGEETTVVLSRAVPAGFARPPGRLALADLVAPVRAVGADAAGGAAGGADVYVCGSTGFAGAAERLLVEAGVPAGSIRVERFGPS
jgi:ferredoxin-NADP reductase